MLASHCPNFKIHFSQNAKSKMRDFPGDPWCWERLRAGGEGDDRGWDGWMASLTQWTWVWANSGRQRTGKPGVLQPKGLKRVGHNLVTEELQLVVQWIRLHLPMQGVWVRSLVRKLRFHMPRDPKNQMIKQKQYCNKFNKDVKNGSIKKKKE